MGYLTTKKEYNSFSKKGTTFDDEKLAKGDPIGVQVRWGEVIDAVSFIYKDLDNPLHGGEGGGLETFTIPENEYFTKIELLYAPYGGVTSILEITFTVNTGKTFHYGNGNKFSGTKVTYFFDNKPITALIGKTDYSDYQKNYFLSDLGVYYIDKFC